MAATSWLGLIRPATASDTAAIGKLYRTSGYQDHGVDWERPGVEHWWLVGERDGEIRGAIQVVASQPFGCIGDIIVHPDERGRGPDGKGRMGKRPGALAFSLYVAALVYLEHGGVEVVMGVVSEEQKPLHAFLGRYGATDLGGYRLLARRLK